MAKSLLHRLFRFGRLPKRFRTEIEREGIVVVDEGLGVRVTYRKFRAPGTYYGRKTMWFVGSIVLTKKRFACYRGGTLPPVFEVPVDHDSFKAFRFDIDEKSRLKILIDAPAFQEGWKGSIECRVPTDKARGFLTALSAARMRDTI